MKPTRSNAHSRRASLPSHLVVACWQHQRGPLLARWCSPGLTVDVEDICPRRLRTASTCSHRSPKPAASPCPRTGQRHDISIRVSTTGAQAWSCRWSTAGRKRGRRCGHMLYPPPGTRSSAEAPRPQYSAPRANDYFASQTRSLLVVLQCEHIRAVEDATISRCPASMHLRGAQRPRRQLRSKDGRPERRRNSVSDGPYPGTCKKHACRGLTAAPPTRSISAQSRTGWQFLSLGSELKMMLDGTALQIQKLAGTAGTRRHGEILRPRSNPWLPGHLTAGLNGHLPSAPQHDDHHRPRNRTGTPGRPPSFSLSGRGRCALGRRGRGLAM